MPKKVGPNSKAVEAKEKKEAVKAASKVKEAKEKEDREWAEAGEGAKSKAQAKKEEQARAREEAAAKKAEARALAAAEEEQLAASASKKAAARPPAPKVTAHQLEQQREADRRAEEAAARKRAAAAKRSVDEESYSKVVDTENVNRQEDAVEARSVEAAISALLVADSGADAEDKHPERRLKAAWNAYMEAELPVLKQEKPGLKQRQYQDMIWKAWQKSPQNPVVAAQLRAQQDG